MKPQASTFNVILFVVAALLSLSLSATAAPNLQSQLAEISFPGNNEIVRGIISVRGSAVHPSFDRYEMAYAAEPVTNNNQWVGIGQPGQSQVVNGELVVWDTNSVPDGSYRLRLRVVRLDGNYDEIEAQQIVVANAQPTETPTPDPAEEEEGGAAPGAPAGLPSTATPTAPPPTPTIIIEVPLDETATPRPLTITQTLPTPRPDNAATLPIPRIILDTAPLQSAFLWGAGGMLLLFLLFGMLSALRLFFLGFFDKPKRK